MYSHSDTQKEGQLKNQIRKEMQFLRSELRPEEKAQMDFQILQRILEGLRPMERKTVYLYASGKGEVDTWQLMDELWKNKVKVALPRVEGKEIFFYIVDNKDQLIPGFMGIWEPDFSCQRAEEKCALVLTPGLAFSPLGDRIGYGGGYYDRFFARESAHRSVGVAYPFQIRENVDTKRHDQRVHQIVLPDRWIDCRAKQCHI